MTAKEKAKYLIDQYRPIVTSWDCYNDMPMPEKEIIEDAKKGALIAVDEIINEYWSHHNNNRVYWWEEVKQEIQNFKP